MSYQLGDRVRAVVAVNTAVKAGFEGSVVLLYTDSGGYDYIIRFDDGDESFTYAMYENELEPAEDATDIGE